MKKRKTVPIEKIVLVTLATAGVIGAVALAPGIGPALKLFGFGKKKYPFRYVNTAARRLEKKGMIVFEKRGKITVIRLTERGKRELDLYQRRGHLRERTPRKWDGKWRMIIFDIPEKKRVLRNSIRNSLAEFGFVKLQGSVWVNPYECEELITLLKADYHIGKDLLYIVAEKIEYDKPLKKQFGLPVR